MEIRASSPSEPACVRLLSRLDAYLMALYPSDHLHILTLDELLRPEVVFVAASELGTVLGCGALVRRDGYGEIKRMYVEPAARGRRIGERIIRFLEHLSAANGSSVFMEKRLQAQLSWSPDR